MKQDNAHEKEEAIEWDILKNAELVSWNDTKFLNKFIVQ